MYDFWNMATELLKRAFAEAEQLPECEQDILAKTLLAAIEDDSKWDVLLAQTETKLERLADRALKAYQAGEVELLIRKSSDIKDYKRVLGLL